MAPRPVALLDAAAAGWAAAAPALHGAVVYLDAAAAAATAPLGLPLLLGLGALGVCDLAHPRPSDGALQGAPPAAVAIVLTRPPAEALAEIAAVLKCHPGASRATVLCGAPEGCGRAALASPRRALRSAAFAHTAQQPQPAPPPGGADGWAGSDGEDDDDEAGSEAKPSVTAASAPSAAVAEADSDGDSGEEYGDDDDDHADVAGGLRLRLVPFALPFMPLARAALLLPPGGSAAAAPLSPPGALCACGALPPVAETPDAALTSAIDPAAAPGVAAHAAALSAIATALGLRWDCFALGPSALAVARAVAAAAVPAAAAAALGGAALRPAALVLVDRTTDLITPALPTDALLERLAAGPDASSAVASPRAASTGDKDADAMAAALQLPPLAALRDGGGAEAWDAAAGRRCRDAALASRKALLEAMRRQNIAPGSKPKLGAVAPAELRALAAQLEQASGADVALRHRAVTAHARAAADAADVTVAAGHDARVAAAQRLLAAAAGGGGADAVAAVAVAAAQACADPAQEGLTLRHLLPIILAAYGLAGDAAPAPDAASRDAPGMLLLDRVALEGAVPSAVERSLMDAIAAAIASGQPAPWPVASDARGVREALAARFARLREVLRARRALRAAPRSAAMQPLHPLPGGPPALVRTLAAKIAAREDIPELTHVPSSLGGLLKSGFGLFGLQAKPKPGDADVAMLFVLGGVAAGELRDATEAAAIAAAAAAAAEAPPGGAAPEPLELLLGGTALLTPDALAELVFA